MRLEILVDNEEPLIFPMNKPKVMIGSNEVCDIVVNTSGVSRKHLAVVNEGDSYYVIDQGSTNGSYINEERLVPGRKVEFTSFFPVRLGDNVLLTLLSDEDADEVSSLSVPVKAPEAPATAPAQASASRADSTTMISLKNLKAASTQELVKKRSEGMTRKRTESKKAPVKKSDGSSMRNVKIMAVLILGAAVYYNFFVVEPIPAPDFNSPDIAKVGEETPVANPPVVEVEKPKPAIDEADLTPKAKVAALVSDLKCVSEIEKYLCEKIVGAGTYPWGVVQSGSSIYILIERTAYAEAAKAIQAKTPPTWVPDKNGSPVEVAPTEAEQNLLVHFVAFARAVPKDLQLEGLKELKIYLALFNSKDEIASVGAFTAENFGKAFLMLKPEDVDKALETGKGQLPLAGFSRLVQIY